MNKFLINKNIKIKYAQENDLETILNFQEQILKKMPNKDFFIPLTKEEILYPINNNGNIYMLYDKDIFIGFFVFTINPLHEIINEYQLENNNVGILDGVMIKESYRGNNLTDQGLKIIYEHAKNLNINGIVATIHPDNIYSLNPFLNNNYKIINKIIIHNKIRYVVYNKL